MKLIQVKAGYAGLVNKRNSARQVVETTYYDANWKPVRNDERQFATIQYRYNSNDPEAAPVYEEYFDQNGKRCESTDGCYARRMNYGGPQHNLLLSEEFLNEKGKPDTSISTGAYRAVYNYDGNMLQTAAMYYDAEGNPFKAHTGYATLLREYTATGNLLWEVTLDPDRNPVRSDS